MDEEEADRGKQPMVWKGSLRNGYGYKDEKNEVNVILDLGAGTRSFESLEGEANEPAVMFGRVYYLLLRTLLCSLVPRRNGDLMW